MYSSRKSIVNLTNCMAWILVTLGMTITRMVKRYTEFLAFSIAKFHL